MDQIKRLHELQQKSYLTKEEFEELKITHILKDLN